MHHDACIHDDCIHDACIQDVYVHDACIHDGYPRYMYVSLMRVFIMHVSMIHVFMMHMSTILDPDACEHDAPMYVACIYDPRSLTLTHVSMMPISVMQLKFCLGPTNKPILGVGYAPPQLHLALHCIAEQEQRVTQH